MSRQPVPDPPEEREPRIQRVQDRFGLLLLLLIGAFVALGFSAETWARYVAALLEIAALAVAFLATRLRRDHRWLAVVLVVAIIAVVASALTGDTSEGIANIAVTFVFAAMLIAVLDRVLRHRRVTVQTLFGAVCAYFLIGLMFSAIYSALDALGSEPIFGEPVGRSVFSYFSFTALTTVGFGDYTAETDISRRIVVLEAVIGQVFIATTLARLVSLYKSAPAGEPPPPFVEPSNGAD
jgi:drug/metabolite transporter (DMT)-like permease